MDGQMLELELRAHGGPPKQDEFQVQREIVDILRRLRPHAVVGHNKIRIGGLGDGGYVCVDDFAGLNVALSFGIGNNVTWDEDVADRGLTVYQFDHTVDAPRPTDSRMRFSKLMIRELPGDSAQTLDSLITIHDIGQLRPNILLKIDIENYEWPVFDLADPALLSRVAQITGEFHAFEFMAYPEWRARCRRVIEKLTSIFAVVHVHANNYASTTTLSSVYFPNVIELTFINRRLYNIIPSFEIFPTPINSRCNPKRPDIHLGAFVY